jgi:hypothetical protein
MTDAPKPRGIPEELLDPETRGALAALRRARLRAERVAAATGTCIVMEIDGKIVREPSCDDEASKGVIERPWRTRD